MRWAIVALALGFSLGLSLGLVVCPAHAESGIASVYDYGPLTADGERFDPRAMTAAHRTLPFGTLVRVTTAAGRSILVRINDRGPYVRGRIIDLTPAAAHALGFSGLARVTIEPLGRYQPRHGDFGFF
jgi:rare lipoprotein A